MRICSIRFAQLFKSYRNKAFVLIGHVPFLDPNCLLPNEMKKKCTLKYNLINRPIKADKFIGQNLFSLRQIQFICRHRCQCQGNSIINIDKLWKMSTILRQKGTSLPMRVCLFYHQHIFGQFRIQLNIGTSGKKTPTSHKH